MVKRVVLILIVAFFIFYLISQPESAASLVRTIWDLLHFFRAVGNSSVPSPANPRLAAGGQVAAGRRSFAVAPRSGRRTAGESGNQDRLKIDRTPQPRHFGAPQSMVDASV